MDDPIQPSAQFVFKNPIHFLAFGFGTGLSPVAPGTIGTITAIPIYLLMHDLALIGYWIVTLLLLVVGFWICDYTSKTLNTNDHEGIVWDEIVGYLITMGVAPRHWQWVITGFLLFRIFDVIKPWPAGWIDRVVGGGIGIMMDDVIAGLYALLTLHVLSIWIIEIA